jgi:hypothetical protein
VFGGTLGATNHLPDVGQVCGTRNNLRMMGHVLKELGLVSQEFSASTSRGIFLRVFVKCLGGTLGVTNHLHLLDVGHVPCYMS